MNSFQYQMQLVEKKIRLQRRQFQKIGIFYLRNGILSTVKEDEVMNDEEKRTCGSVIFYFFADIADVCTEAFLRYENCVFQIQLL